ANAGADRDADDIRAAPGRAEPPLADGRAVRVVVERARNAQPRLDAVAQREIVPAEVRRDDYDALLAVERTGSADADADDVLPGASRLVHRVEDHALDEPDDPVHDALGAELGLGVDLPDTVRVRAVLAHTAAGDLGATEVET